MAHLFFTILVASGADVNSFVAHRPMPTSRRGPRAEMFDGHSCTATNRICSPTWYFINVAMKNEGPNLG
jgi:hypothetical protein